MDQVGNQVEDNNSDSRILTQENFHCTASRKICDGVLSIISNRKNDDLRNLKSTQRALPSYFIAHRSSIVLQKIQVQRMSAASHLLPKLSQN
jgi:hypothetical protein